MSNNIYDLSIIIPVYNTENYFKKCINSVMDSVSGLINVEVLVINDGSKGNINELIKEYLDKYKDLIKYFDKENIGRAGTRNFGIEISKGKYITFVDSDDEVDKNYYKKVIEIINNENPDVIVCDIESINGDIKFRTHAKNSRISDNRWGCFDISVMPSCCNKIFRKELFNEQNKFPIGYNFEDLSTVPIIMLTAKNIVYIPEMLYKYNIHENSIMHSEFSEKKFEIIDIIKILFVRLDKLDILIDEKNRAKHSVYYQRLYFELLEPISKLEDFNKYNFCKVLCQKIQKLHKRMNGNVYYKLEKNKGRLKRQWYAHLVDFALYNNLPLLLTKIIKKAVYYNNQYVEDMWCV
ncbi:MAG: glycosyltransferase [Clostridia bacterium]|nr:glycosyltransferase [Clostridia bacterium]